MRKATLLSGVVAFILTIHFSLGMSSAPQTPVVQTGTIRGTIVRAGTTDPISQARVTVGGARISLTPQQAQSVIDAAGRGSVVPPDILETAQNLLKGRSPIELSAVSDSAGRFLIKDVPVGTMPIRAELEGYFGTSSGGAYPSFASTNIRIEAGKFADVAIAMVPSATVSGRVLDSSGSPLRNAEIQVLGRMYEESTSRLRPVGTRRTTSDDRGEYRAFGVPPGEYYLAAIPLRTLPPSLQPAGEPMLLPTLYPGTVDPSAAQPIAVKAGANMSGVDIRVYSAAGYRIAGRVVSSLPPGPVVTTQASARLPAGSVRPSIAQVTLLKLDISGVADPSAPVVNANAADGTFEFRGITPGRYALYARLPVTDGWGDQNPPGFAPNAFAYGRAAVEVRGSDVEGVAVSVTKGSDLKGKIILDGKPTAAAVQIGLRAVDDSSSRIGSIYSQLEQYQPAIEADGSFTIPLVPPGTYRFQINLGAAPLRLASANRGQRGGRVPQEGLMTVPAAAYVSDVRQGSDSLYDNGLVVGLNEVPQFEVLVSSNSANMTGTVVDSARMPFANATVALVPGSARRQNPGLYKTARTDEEGRFKIDAIAPGTYKAFAWESIAPRAYTSAEFLKKYEERGVTVTINAGSPSTSVLNVIRAE